MQSGFVPPKWMRHGFKVALYGTLVLNHVYNIVPPEYRKFVARFGGFALIHYFLINGFAADDFRSGNIGKRIPLWLRRSAKATSCSLFALTYFYNKVPEKYRNYVLMFGYTAIACYNLINVRSNYLRNGVNEVPPLEHGLDNQYHM